MCQLENEGIRALYREYPGFFISQPWMSSTETSQLNTMVPPSKHVVSTRGLLIKAGKIKQKNNSYMSLQR
jgi:hypothetical protein